MRRCVKEFADDVCHKVRDIELINKACNIVTLYLGGKITEFDAMSELVKIETNSRED